MNRIIIGIDISRKKFDAACRSVDQKWQQGAFDNSSEGFKSFIQWLEEKILKSVMPLWKLQVDMGKIWLIYFTYS